MINRMSTVHNDIVGRQEEGSEGVHCPWAPMSGVSVNISLNNYEYVDLRDSDVINDLARKNQ